MKKNMSVMDTMFAVSHLAVKCDLSKMSEEEKKDAKQLYEACKFYIEMYNI